MRKASTVAAVLAASVLAVGPAAPAHALSPRPKYLDPTVGLFSVFANSNWVVGGHQAAQFGTPAAGTHGYTIAGNEAPRYMWAATCSTGKQRLTFHRRIWLPGQPQTLQFFANPSPVTYWATPFTSVVLTVNDKVIVNSHRSAISEQLYGAKLPAAFRPGNNDVVLSVTKAPNPSSVKSCGARSSTRLGIELGLIGQGFPIDLSVVPVPTAEKTKWVHLKPGQSWPFIYYLHVTNKGPTASGAGQFGFLVQPGFMTWSVPLDSADEAPFTCSPIASNSVGCTYNNWFGVGKTVKLTMYGKLTAPTDEPDTDVEEVSIDWGVGAQNQQHDLNSANDSTGQTVYICYPAATAYGCDKH